MDLRLVMNQVLVLFIILLMGFAAGKAGVIDQTASKKLAGVMLYVTSPMLVLNSFFITFTGERLINIFWTMGMAMFMFLLSIWLSKLIYGRFPEKTSPILRFTAVFSNCGYMGLPIMYALYGDDGVIYGSVYIVAFNIMLWTYGYALFGGRGTKREIAVKVFANPCIIAVYTGMIIFIFGLAVPVPVASAVTVVGDMTMPVSMLIIGAVISSARLRDVFSDWRVYLSSFVRLVLMPLIALALASIPGIPHMPAAVIVTASAMPAAANTTVFAEMFDKDAMFASKCVSVSTLLSIITIPTIVSLI